MALWTSDFRCTLSSSTDEIMPGLKEPGQMRQSKKACNFWITSKLFSADPPMSSCLSNPSPLQPAQLPSYLQRVQSHPSQKTFWWWHNSEKQRVLENSLFTTKLFLFCKLGPFFSDLINVFLPAPLTYDWAWYLFKLDPLFTISDCILTPQICRSK